MRFIFFFCLIAYCVYASPSVAQDSYQSDLIAIKKSIKAMESRKNEIDAALNKLTIEKNVISDSLFKKRYQAVKNLHLFYSREKSNPVFGFIASKQSFYDRYFNHRYQHNINQILHHALETDIGQFIEIETKIAEINQFEREKALLNQTLQSALSYVRDTETKNRNNAELDLMITELKNQSQSLNDFIGRLLNTPNAQKYKPDHSSKTNFILPASGIIKQDMGGLFIETNTQSLVTAPGDGQILFADDYKRLGKIIIIDHGNGYISVLRGLDTLLVNTGVIIIQGDAVGIVGNGPQDSKNNDKSTIKTMLYYELRYNGKTVNPIEHLSGS